MRIGFLDCFAGISGDMLLGALVNAGVDPQALESATAALNIGAELRFETVNRSGISATRVHVLENGSPAEHTHPHSKEPHSHDHKHSHGRSLSAIRTLILEAPLEEPVKRLAIAAFELLGRSEAKIHNVPIEEIHFHEVGAVDSIVDIVAVCAGVHALKVDAWHCSPLNVGSGTVVCAHGTFPVPAPATADLLRGAPTYSAHVEKELVTPTGAALVRALAPTFGPQPAMTVDRIGYGAGSRITPNFPNVLRLTLGESSTTVGESQGVTVIETALDDLSPQILAHVAETALATGALDVMLTPVIMKKGRPGTLLTILCDEDKRSQLEQLLLTETSTLGVRVRQEVRTCLDRIHQSVATEYGEIRIKIASRNGQEINAAPEFEDCRAAAAIHPVPLKQVQQAAIAAYRNALRARQPQ